MTARNQRQRDDTDMDKAPQNATNLYVSIGVVVTLILFVIGITWNAGSERNRINNQIEQLSSSVLRLQNTVEKLATVIRPNTWTKEDQLIWCLKTQIINPSWRCPNVDDVKPEAVPTP